MKFIVAAIVTLSAVAAFATETHTATTTKETTTTAAPAAPVVAAPGTTTTMTKETSKKEASKADMCAKLTDAKAKADCEKKAVHKM
jgi:flagellar basal body-associated protein FliL